MPPFTPGTLVLCQYRLPPIIQPWIHEFYVGTVEQPNTDRNSWNGTNSEQHYCEVTRTVKVRYVSGVQYEHADRLMAITPEQASLSHREKVAEFLGPEALAYLDSTSGLKVSK